VKAWMRRSAENVAEVTELDSEAKTVIFANTLRGCSKFKVLFADLAFGLVDGILTLISRLTLDTVNLQALWFPAPFYTFWKAKFLIHSMQIDGCRLSTTATQADAYMKFCTETMLNFWTLGFYGRLCTKRTSYTRWLDRHIMWQGNAPPGYNNQFRVFHVGFTLCQRINIFFVKALLFLLGGVLKKVPWIGGLLSALWPISHILTCYSYRKQLQNYLLGGSVPHFSETFTIINYIIIFYTIGVCGCCGHALLRWTDTCIVMGEPTFDEDLAKEDAEADAATAGDEQNSRFADQVTGGPPGYLDADHAATFKKNYEDEPQPSVPSASAMEEGEPQARGSSETTGAIVVPDDVHTEVADDASKTQERVDRTRRARSFNAAPRVSSTPTSTVSSSDENKV